MIEDPEFLTVDDVLELHRDQIERYGGDPGIRDRGLIEAAVAMPRQSFGGQFLHVDLFEMAAAYAFHLAEGQAFLDGNKRVGLAAAYVFLELNGYVLSRDEDRLYDAMIAIGTHQLDKAGLAKVLRECSVPDEEI
ncbi:MAG TPA: type II toxin-antitoxin system death-on-curing family toxin [Polyangia bacterium]|nr:type II toxin-antitoxin system death-on-curing family toxin [Polyangia bacterium]